MSSVIKNQPLDRFLAVLGAVTHSDQPVSITEVAALAKLPLPTVHRLVAQLEERALLKRALGSKRLTAGQALVRLSEAAVGVAFRDDSSHQILAALSEQIGEHCQIGQRTDNEVVYVDAVSAKRSQGLNFEHGVRAPMHCSSIGKLFLAEMSARQFAAWLQQTDLAPIGPNTITTHEQLHTIVEATRKSQWAASNEEMAAGVVGCAVPIRGRAGKLIAGLGISVPSARVSYDELDRFRSRMETAARSIAQALDEG